MEPDVLKRNDLSMEITATVAPQAAKRQSGLTAYAWIKIAAVVGLVVALYIGIISDLAQEWWTVDSSSYGMLVPPITLYIAYLRRETTLSIPAQSDLRGL